MLLSSPAFAGAEEEDAIKHVSSAAYEQLGLDKKVNELIEQNIPKQYLELSTKFGPIIRVIVTGRMDVKWTF